MRILIRFFTLLIVSFMACFLIFFALSKGSVIQWFSEASPFVITAFMAGVFSFMAFLFALFSGDYSWVDRLWSTLPVFMGWVYAFHSGWEKPLLIAAILITLWGARLTFNFARRGGYSGMEDYRWKILRDKISNPMLWQLFHFFFICLFQVGLFVLFISPLKWISSCENLSSISIWAFSPFCFFILYETLADQQQWNFQRCKRGVISSSKYSEAELKQGFCSSGLFRWSRHPNYFGELGVWWSLYFLSAYVSGQWINWSISGASILTVLFIGSTIFTENISSRKYADYRLYKKHTSAIIPWYSRYSPNSSLD